MRNTSEIRQNTPKYVIKSTYPHYIVVLNTLSYFTPLHWAWSFLKCLKKCPTHTIRGAKYVWNQAKIRQNTRLNLRILHFILALNILYCLFDMGVHVFGRISHLWSLDRYMYASCQSSMDHDVPSYRNRMHASSKHAWEYPDICTAHAEIAHIIMLVWCADAQRYSLPCAPVLTCMVSRYHRKAKKTWIFRCHAAAWAY